MGLSVYARAWRAGIIACGLAWVGPVDLRAETPELSAPSELIQRSAEPFGLAAASLSSGGLRDKWLGVQRRLDDEMVQLALCEGDRDGCASPAALKFLDIVDAARLREGRARLGEINRAINLAIRPVSDPAQHGRIDVDRRRRKSFAARGRVESGSGRGDDPRSRALGGDGIWGRQPPRKDLAGTRRGPDRDCASRLPSGVEP